MKMYSISEKAFKRILASVSSYIKRKVRPNPRKYYEKYFNHIRSSRTKLISDQDKKPFITYLDKVIYDLELRRLSKKLVRAAHIRRIHLNRTPKCITCEHNMLCCYNPALPEAISRHDKTLLEAVYKTVEYPKPDFTDFYNKCTGDKNEQKV